jgi:hypothetical protein
MFSIHKVLGHLAMPLPALLLLALGAVAVLDGSPGRSWPGWPSRCSGCSAPRP